jgi:APA family basic amino acid/polyamine antiporter
MGEVFAWVMGWLLLLEYGVAASTVASGWTGYVTSLLGDFGVHFGSGVTVSTMKLQDGVMQMGSSVNVVGAIGILAVTSLLVIGVKESATVNNVIVAIKLTVLLAFIAVGVFYVSADNWHPFIPANEGGFKYGFQGVLRAASIIFFAYVGFEAVSTAAGEARNPQKDLPIGILGSLIICTVLYIAVAAVMTGVVPYKELAGGAPIAVAIDRMNPQWAVISWSLTENGHLNLLAFLIKIGAFTGLSSVMLVLMYAQTRVFYQMAKDGLLPNVFARVNQKFKTPAAGTVLLGVVIAFAAATLPLDVLNDLVSLGTAVAFAIVCMSVIYLRRRNPTMKRPFEVPWYPVTPILGVIFCLLLMMGPILTDILSKAFDYDIMGHLVGAPGDVHKDPIAMWILVGYFTLGALVYALYGYRNSKQRAPAK